MKYLKMKKRAFILLFTFICIAAMAQQESPDVRTGNKLFKAEKYTEAEVAYRRGLAKNPKSFDANYNLGNALFKQKKYSDALEQYQKSIALQPGEKEKLAAAFHNSGNALLTDKKIEESINAYKMALKANPNDNETRYNLAFAQAMLKKQQQDKNKDNKDNKKDNKDQNKDKDKKDEQKQDQDKKDQDKQNEQQKQQPKMTKENAQQILDALQQDEKGTLDKAKKQQVGTRKSADKDW